MLFLHELNNQMVLIFNLFELNHDLVKNNIYIITF